MSAPVPPDERRRRAPSRHSPEHIWLRHYAEQAAEATVHRDQLIRELRENGHTLRSLAGLTGLSHTQIANICQKG